MPLGAVTPIDLFTSARKRLENPEDQFGLGVKPAPISPAQQTISEGGGSAPVDVGGGAGGGGPAAPGGVGVGTMPLGAGTPRWATWAPATPSQSVADAVKERMSGKGLSKDPQLPQAPGGSYTDSQYQAANATLEQQVNAAYADILQQTGFDVDGKHTPGTVEMGAARKERDYLTQMVNSANDVTSQMQQAGTIFSGYHAAERAKAEQPAITALGDLNVDTPNTLAHLTEGASDLMRQFVAQRNQLLADAAWRQEQRLLLAQAAAKPPGDFTDTTTAPADPYAGYQISGGTGTNMPGEGLTATYDPNPTYGAPGTQPAPWAPSGQPGATPQYRWVLRNGYWQKVPK